MPQLTPYQDDYRNQVTDSMLQQPPLVKPNTLASTLTSAIPTNLAQQFTTGAPAGMPQTPQGGVPGSGLAPPPASIVQLPKQLGGTLGEMQTIPTKGTRKQRGY